MILFLLYEATPLERISGRVSKDSVYNWLSNVKEQHWLRTCYEQGGWLSSRSQAEYPWTLGGLVGRHRISPNTQLILTSSIIKLQLAHMGKQGRASIFISFKPQLRFIHFMPNQQLWPTSKTKDVCWTQEIPFRRLAGVQKIVLKVFCTGIFP